MAYKQIIAVAGGSDDGDVLACAAALAARFDAVVRVLPAFEDTVADLVAYGATLREVSTDVLARVRESERERQESLEALAAERAQAAGSQLVVEQRDLQPASAVAIEAVLADLVIMGGKALRTLSLANLFAETLLTSRAPVLLVKGPASFERAAVAWDGSAQAGRAVRAALPLLENASSVVVLTNVAAEQASAARPEALADYLRLHGVKELAVRQISGGDVPQSLLDAARSENSDLLVAGGYGRPRLYELVLGGATRSFVRAEAMPHVLLAH